MTIDVEAEAQQYRQRSAELAGMLDAGVPTVDKSGIRQALAESKRLEGEVADARAEVSKRLARGAPAGCPVGPHLPIRPVVTDFRGVDLDPQLRGRTPVTPQLLQFWQHRKDVVADAIRTAYTEAGERLNTQPALLAACRGHVAELRQRGAFVDEGGGQLLAALQRHQDAAELLRSGPQEADEVEGKAREALERLRSLPMLAEMEAEQGPMALASINSWVIARVSAAIDQPVDAKTGKPIPLDQVKPASSRATPRAKQYAWQES
jgi:hypothetical protein